MIFFINPIRLWSVGACFIVDIVCFTACQPLPGSLSLRDLSLDKDRPQQQAGDYG